MSKRWNILCILFLSSNLAAFPRADPVPGGIAQIPLGQANEQMPQAEYGGQRLTIIPHQQQWVALVGIPLNASAGTQSIQLSNGQQITFEIEDRQYKTQRIRIKDKNKVDPDDESSERIVREMAIQEQLKTHFSTQPVNLDFIRPVPGRDTGRFGLRRIINEQPRNPHSGMDIAAASGTPVKVTAPGRVLHTDEFFFSGNVVYVDHGSGVISMYAHLSKIQVKAGDIVQQGDIIGEVGNTGRATGPHLHWSVYLNGEAVNPSLFL